MTWDDPYIFPSFPHVCSTPSRCNCWTYGLHKFAFMENMIFWVHWQWPAPWAAGDSNISESEPLITPPYKRLFFSFLPFSKEDTLFIFVHATDICRVLVYATDICGMLSMPHSLSMPQSLESFLFWKKKTQMTEAYWVCCKYLWHTRWVWLVSSFENGRNEKIISLMLI